MNLHIFILHAQRNILHLIISNFSLVHIKCQTNKCILIKENAVDFIYVHGVLFCRKMTIAVDSLKYKHLAIQNILCSKFINDMQLHVLLRYFRCPICCRSPPQKEQRFSL